MGGRLHHGHDDRAVARALRRSCVVHGEHRTVPFGVVGLGPSRIGRGDNDPGVGAGVKPARGAFMPEPHQTREFLILGLAGGIGSGKSAVAAVLGELGFVVSDSDAGAREVLGRADVIQELVAAFGKGVLDEHGAPNRQAIADAVFGNDDARRNLASIIHPRLHDARAALITRARDDRARGVVIDAPLLFAAGVDAECDAVIFVDTPRAERLRRVREGRGWSEAELDRREAAQLPLDEKRGRSDAVVTNGADLEALKGRVRMALQALETRKNSP